MGELCGLSMKKFIFIEDKGLRLGSDCSCTEAYINEKDWLPYYIYKYSLKLWRKFDHAINKK